MIYGNEGCGRETHTARGARSGRGYPVYEHFLSTTYIPLHADPGASLQGAESADLRQADQFGGLSQRECGRDTQEVSGEAGGLCVWRRQSRHLSGIT